MLPPFSPSRVTPSRTVIFVAASVLAVLLTASPVWAQQISISVTGPAPDPMTIEAGQSVEFVNDGEDDIRLVDDMGRWDSGTLQAGDTFAITFDEVGEVSYSSQDGTIQGAVSVIPADAVVNTLPNTGLPTTLLASLALAAFAVGMVLLRRTA